jgi:hypothetical protein
MRSAILESQAITTWYFMCFRALANRLKKCSFFAFIAFTLKARTESFGRGDVVVW